MYTTKHTPGPWEIIEDAVIEIIPVDTGDVIAYVEQAGYNRDEVQANAYLIAAAPELLKMMKETLVEMEELSNEETKWISFIGRTNSKKLRSVIAKAEGRLSA